MIQKEFFVYECYNGQASPSGFGPTNKTVNIKTTFITSHNISDIPGCVSFYALTSVFVEIIKETPCT